MAELETRRINRGLRRPQQTNLMVGTKIFYGVHSKTDAGFRTKVAIRTKVHAASQFRNFRIPVCVYSFDLYSVCSIIAGY